MTQQDQFIEDAWQRLSRYDQFNLARRISANIGYRLTPVPAGLVERLRAEATTPTRGGLTFTRISALLNEAADALSGDDLSRAAALKQGEPM